MSDSYAVVAEPLTDTAFAPFGQVIDKGDMVMELRDGEEFHLNVLSYDRRPLVCDHLNRHHKATQALVALGGRPTVIVVAPKAYDFSTRDHLEHVRCFLCDGTAGVNLALGTWHWGPYPLMDHVDLVNVQGANFADDNEVAHLERDLGVVVSVALCMAADDVGLVPRTVLFGNPERVSPRISPDGTQLAWIAPADGVLNVWVAPVGAVGDPAQARTVTDDKDRGIREYFWAHDGRHLLYVQDQGGDENWRLYAVDVTDADSPTRDLTPFDGVQARIEALDKRHPDTVLVGLNRDDPALHDVYRLTLSSGELKIVLKNPGFVGVLADTALDVRIGVVFEDDGGATMLTRDPGGGDDDWRPLLTVTDEDALTTDPVAFTADGTGVYVITSHDANAARLVRLDCATGAVTVLAEDAVYDVGGAHLHPDTREPQLAVFVKDRAEYEVLDPAVADDLAALQALDAGDLVLQGRDHADATWLAGFTNDDGPIRYFAFDRAARKGTFLFEHQPALSEYRLAAMEPFTLTSRDGLELHGYATFPVGDDRRSLPTVLDVHGGPWHRDSWGFDPETQWLANRGYLCLRVNFRGSTGYGKAFLNAGNREWGAKMHDDLVDTVAFAVEQGWADPAKVAIYGGSYGGYAALVGATFTPDLFCCAVDIVGPSSLETLIRSIPPYWAPMLAQFHNRVGNPDTEPEFMWSRSPLSKVDQIRIPLLIAQGANDPRVKQAEAEQIVAALTAKGIEHEYLLFPDEGHGFAKPENRLRFYAAAEAFLAKHLGGRAEP